MLKIFGLKKFVLKIWSQNVLFADDTFNCLAKISVLDFWAQFQFLEENFRFMDALFSGEKNLNFFNHCFENLER